MLTSSFPRDPQDETCGYIRDFARSLASEFDVQILAPAESKASDWPLDSFRLVRSKSFLPERMDPLQASRDFNNLSSESRVVKAALLISLLCFFARAVRLAFKADVVCSHWMLPSGLAGAVIARALGRPHMLVEHSGALHMLARMRGGRAIARFIINNSDRIITVSADLRDKLTELCPEAARKIEVIPMGIRLNGSKKGRTGITESAKPETCLRTPRLRCILFIGRLTGIKGVDSLLRAMKQIDGAQLLIAGDGEMRAELDSLARELSVDAKFLGSVGAEERSRLLAACDMVVIPSLVLPSGRTEGMPVACLEAMAAGRAVIASRAGGLAEVIVDGYNGLLFEPGDHFRLAERLNLVLGDADLKLWLEANARRTVARFEWSQTGLRFSKIIKGILRNG